jgi:hypothetical protein
LFYDAELTDFHLVLAREDPRASAPMLLGVAERVIGTLVQLFRARASFWKGGKACRARNLRYDVEQRERHVQHSANTFAEGVDVGGITLCQCIVQKYARYCA